MHEFVSRTNLLNYLAKKDYLKFQNILADWSSILQESNLLAESNPDYWCEVVPEEGDYTSWDDLGDDLSRSYDISRQYGYTKHNTKVWETTTQQPKLEMDWEKHIASQLPLQFPSTRPTLQTPGNVMPWHQDKFIYFRRLHTDQSEYIVRFIVFMKDWDIGHFLQAGNSVISHWKAGDVILWHPHRLHLSANVGISDKWTLNVTGILQEEVNYQSTN